MRHHDTELYEYLQQFLTAERLQRIDEVLSFRTRHITVVLEDVFQPHNISAVLRSSDAFGVQDVHVIENYNEFETRRKIAAGTDRWLTIHRYQDEVDPRKRCVEHLRARGYRLVGTSPHGRTMSISELPIDEPVALVFGGEKEGVSDELLAACDERVFLPMYGFVESFNISVAAAIALNDLTTRLRQSGIDWGLTSDERDVLRRDWVRASVRHLEAIERRFYEDRQNQARRPPSDSPSGSRRRASDSRSAGKN
ncbi:tRNA (guanosine(18)-2'-O)-methyltransferase [Maioricimonas rarisocia]|uniref:tRNA (guanosine(18)-2'-O)-methyltransferase n=1 Tax=Maioricimonas rarisocia TaxID=2528026 RepID=A0A517Z532_9PLAN|nr:RNA methyltransferase [Maioricimonas rarisocia]QDU37564.1 tRNA (guanosine(18)-2'-O)-methyltransferase [Maioricimonas rarisocia]